MFMAAVHDFRCAVRTLMRTPGFSLTALVTISVCIGATTAVFGVVNHVLFRPLPLPEAARVVTFWHRAPSKGLDELNLSDALFSLYRDRARQFDGIAGYEVGRFVLSGTGDPEVLTGARVSFNYFDVLGREPRSGRTFVRQEEARGGGDVAILSHGLWQRRFGGATDVVGRTVRLNDRPMVVVGIMPPDFDFPDRAERADIDNAVQLWVPKTMDAQDVNSWNLSAIGRLRNGANLADGQREIESLWRIFLSEAGTKLPDAFGTDTATAMVTLHRRIVGNIRTALLVLLAGAGTLLLIACANIANLFLIRIGTRRREFAVRQSLGATPQQLVRPVFAESVLLSVVGAAGGFALAAAALTWLRSVPPGQLPRAADLTMDWHVLVFTLAVASVTAMLCGVVPALRSTRVNVQEVVNQGPRGTTSGSSRKYNDVFVIAQLAMSLVLLIAAAALLLQSFRNLMSTDPGFRPQHVLMGQIPSLPASRYPSNVHVQAFYDRLLDALRAFPGVQLAELSQVVPFSGGGGGAPFTVEGHEPPPGEPSRVSWWRAVTPGYFSAIGAPVLRGRPFANSDGTNSLPVAIVDEKLARMHWADGDAIGKRIRIGQGPWMTIVGVVPGVKNRNLDEETMPYVYQPYAQRIRREMTLVLRSTVDTAALATLVRKQIAAIDPEQPIFNITTIEDAMRRSVAPARATNLLMSWFAIAAFGLAIVGIYGVLSLNVNSRANEFGIRMALGERPVTVCLLVVGQALRLTLVALALGLVGALGASRFLEELLFGVRPMDPTIFISVASGLTAIALVAAFIPARRATSVDPLTALRCQ